MPKLNDILEELRRLAFASPGRGNFRKICLALDKCSNDAVPLAIDYIAGHLEEWPDEVRKVPQGWRRRLIRGKREPRAAICCQLSLSGLGLFDHGLGLVFREPALRNIRQLDLSDNPDLSTDAVRILAQREDLEGMRCLDLTRSRPGSEGIEALAAVRWPLQILKLEQCGLEGDDVVLLTAAPFAETLVWLDLSGNPIGNDGAAALACAERLTNLEFLGLANAAIDARGLLAIDTSAAMPRLSEVTLSGNPGADVYERYGLGNLVRLNTLCNDVYLDWW